MATNFKITVRRENRCLHLTLSGHFDGSSAYELIHLLQKLCRGGGKAYIHTGRLAQVYAFGRNTFRNNLNLLTGQGISLVFIGEKAEQILAEQGKNNNGLGMAVA
jgi:anti-anti-sigma regulatory factor